MEAYNAVRHRILSGPLPFSRRGAVGKLLSRRQRRNSDREHDMLCLQTNHRTQPPLEQRRSDGLDGGADWRVAELRWTTPTGGLAGHATGLRRTVGGAAVVLAAAVLTTAAAQGTAAHRPRRRCAAARGRGSRRRSPVPVRRRARRALAGSRLTARGIAD